VRGLRGLAVAALAAALAACLARFFLLLGFPAGGFGPRAGASPLGAPALVLGLRLVRPATPSRAGRSSVLRVSSRLGLGFVPGLGFLARGLGSSFQSTGVVVPGAAGYSRKQITDLEDVAKTYGAKGLAWMKVTADGLDGGISKFFSTNAAEVQSTLEAKEGDLLLFVADSWKVACTALGAVRTRLGRDLELFDPKEFRFAWIVDFPLFDWNEDRQGWEASHHMFTMPQEQYLDTMESDPGAVKGDLYDLVCNGVELASGSIRIHDPAIQRRI